VKLGLWTHPKAPGGIVRVADADARVTIPKAIAAYATVVSQLETFPEMSRLQRQVYRTTCFCPTGKQNRTAQQVCTPITIATAPPFAQYILLHAPISL
jgi:hypothetical protein